MQRRHYPATVQSVLLPHCCTGSSLPLEEKGEEEEGKEEGEEEEGEEEKEEDNKITLFDLDIKLL